MRVVVQDTIRNKQWVGYNGVAGFVVGRDADCDVCLKSSRFVSRRHFSVDRSEEGWELSVESGTSALTVDDSMVDPGSSAVLRPISRVRVAEFVLTLIEDRPDAASAADAALEDINELQREVHQAVLRRLDLRRSDTDSVDASGESLQKISDFIDDLMHNEFRERIVTSELTRHRLLAIVYENRVLTAGPDDGRGEAIEGGRVEIPGLNVALEEMAADFTRRLMRRVGLDGAEDSTPENVEDLYRKLAEEIPATVVQTPENVQFYLVGRFLKKVVCDLVFGLGPLQDLLDTPAITEIMVVSPTLVYVERSGRVIRSNRTFLGDEALLAVMERIVAPMGRRIDISTPLVDARLKDGSRVNAVIPPLALKGPCLTIRRFPSHRITPEDLINWGSLTVSAAELLRACVIERKNIVVAGGTGSGKTTFLNVLSGYIPGDERLVTIEDAAELRLQQEHVVSLETRPPNVEGKGDYTIRDLVKNALRMRPDRIIVGECRGEEAFDMLQAMNTGHDGSMTTVHANSAEDVIARIETMCLMAVEIPIAAIRRQISQAVNVIVFIRRLKGGRRLTCQVTEVLGLHPHTGEVEMRDIMAARLVDDKLELRPTGYLPTFIGDLVEKNVLDLDKCFGGGAA